MFNINPDKSKTLTERKMKSAKLHLGCGYVIKKGFINIDNNPDVNPDIVCNLGHEKLPFEDDSVNYVFSNHFFEHLDTDESIFLLDELYRVCKPGAVIKLVCPHQMSPVAGAMLHKQNVSERFFSGYCVGVPGNKQYFNISYKLDFMRYRPKRSGLLRLLPFINIIPCNIYFKLEVVKNEKNLSC